MFDKQPSLRINNKTKSCLIECEGLYTDVTQTKWAEMEILDGVLSKYDKTENYDTDEIHTPWEKIQTFHGWPSNYAKYKLGFDEMAIQYYNRRDGKGRVQK